MPSQVENILVIGHSCCGGIRALMSMQNDANARLNYIIPDVGCPFSFFDIIVLYISHLVIFSIFSSFIKSWVVVGKNARIKTEAVASFLNFDQQCRHCEKVVLFIFVIHVLVGISKHSII